MSILVIGRNGQVARALLRRAATRGVAIEALGRPDIDLMHPDSIRAAISARRPSVVISAAAYTSVDQAEDESARAFAVNAEAAGAVATAAAEAGAALLQLSTDYVFRGDQATPYREDDPANPCNVYGASKLKGEQMALAANPRAVVVRTAWLYGAEGLNFVRAMLKRAQTHETVRVVDDQFGTPTFVDDLADALLAITASIQGGAGVFGVFHCAGAVEASWASFARAIFEESRRRGGATAEVVPISSAEFGARAMRPADSRLACDKLKAAYGLELRSWHAALPDCVDAIAASGWRLE